MISILSESLADAEKDHEQAATGAMNALIELKAIETVPLIRRAFELHKIDETMYGSWGEVLKQIGVEPELDAPLIEGSRQRFEEKHRQMFPQSLRDGFDAVSETASRAAGGGTEAQSG